MPEATPSRKTAAPRKRKTPRATQRKTARSTITILQVRSGIGCNIGHKRVLRALGLRHPHHKVVRTDNAAVRGMVNTIPHLVRIVEK